jgi:hypothetical protein
LTSSPTMPISARFWAMARTISRLERSSRSMSI